MTVYAVTEPVVLPPDAELVPVEDLPEELRAEIEHRPGDHALTRPLSRHPSTIVDQSTARLLEGFRTPTRIVDAIIGFSAAQGSDPAETLEQAFPVLQGFVNAGLLVPADSELARPIEGTLAPGDVVDGLVVVSVAQVMVDTEVYLTRTEDGRRVALKLARAGFERKQSTWFAHEAAVLRLLDGTATPRLVAEGVHEGLPYLALSWCDGSDAHEAAAELRLRGATARDELLGLVEAVLAAYARIHEQGVVHGDVHPRNVLVDPSGAVTVIDFGLARPLRQGGRPEPPRGGIDFFMEPELAARRLAGLPLAPADPAGEQYSVAALAYLLLTGAHTHRFSLEERRMLHQLVDDPPLRFAEHGVRGLEPVEHVIARALAKRPEDRFGDLEEMLAAYRRAVVELDAAPRPRQTAVPSPAAHMLDQVLARLDISGPLLDTTLEAPTASLHNGAAGFAAALLGIAAARDDVHLLALADVWSQRALVASASSDAFVNEALEITSETFGTRSLFHCETGVHWMAARIAAARGDDAAAEHAATELARLAAGPYEHDDVAFGPAGGLVGCALLLPHLPPQARDTVHTTGEQLSAAVCSATEQRPTIGDPAGLRVLGVAHGWGGLLYAPLLWAEAAGAAPAAWLPERLDELASHGIPAGRGLRWPHAVGAEPDALWPSWCNGSAGLVHLWALAYRCLGEQRYAELAEQAAWSAFEAPDGVGDLCCGLAGRSYAALAAFKLTRDDAWLQRARTLADRAALRVAQYALRRDSLYKGEIGVALLAAELERPLESHLPVFEAEGWAFQIADPASRPDGSERRDQS